MSSQLTYFDVLKGIAIFLVVMGHVIVFCVRGIDATPHFKFIGSIHMPLFFFISGYFFLFPLGCCRDALLSMNLAIVPSAVFMASVSAAIIAVVLAADAIISRSPLLALLLTGTMPENTNRPGIISIKSPGL